MSDNALNITPFWMEDISVLFRFNNMTKIIPTKKMSRSEQLNSITRFCLYYIILLYITNTSEDWIKIPIIIIVFTVVMHFIYQSDEHGKSKDLIRLKSSNIENMENITDDYIGKKEKIGTDYDIEVGRYDENNKLSFNAKSKYDKALKNIKYSFDELTEFNKSKCRKPTKDNPFMNPTLNDIGKQSYPAACNDDDDNINDEIDNKFNEDLFRDIDDLFSIKNSQRQFYTVPSTSNPPDTTKFANWLYKSPTTCKNDQSRCLRYEDIRFKS